MKRILTLIMALMAISLALFAGGSAEETDPNAPIKIGSIQAYISGYKGLKYPLESLIR